MLLEEESPAYADGSARREGGSIINMGSVASRITSPNSAVYSGTKAAVDAITIVLSRELGPKKIRVNTLSPPLGLDPTLGKGLKDCLPDHQCQS
jgi:short-subunit dehydrogenase